MSHSYVDAVIRAHQGRRTDIDNMWRAAQEYGVAASVVEYMTAVENELNRSGLANDRIAASMEAGMGGTLYAHLTNRNSQLAYPDNRHHDYLEKYNKIVDFLNRARMSMAVGGMPTAANNNNTVSGIRNNATYTAGIPDVSISVDARRTIDVPTLDELPTEPVQSEQVPVIEIEAIEPEIVKPIASKRTGLIFMESYEQHELAANIAKTTRNLTVREVVAATKQYLASTDTSLFDKVESFLTSGRRATIIGKDETVKLTRKDLKTAVVYTVPSDMLNTFEDDMWYYTDLEKILREIGDFDLSSTAVEDMWLFISSTITKIKKYCEKLNVYGEQDKCYSHLTLSSIIKQLFSETVAYAWTAATNNTLPPTASMPGGAEAPLSPDPLDDMESFYNNVLSPYYIDDLGIVSEETEFYEIAARLIRAMQTISAGVDVNEYKSGEVVEAAEVVVSAIVPRIIIQLDCIIKSQYRNGPLNKLVGAMAPQLSDIYQAATDTIPGIDVELVSGGVYAKIVGSVDATSNLNFIRFD